MSDPEYGPRGYLPERAAQRARKIILREQLGLGWVLGAIAAGVVLAVAGVLFMTRGDALSPPAADMTEVAPIDGLPDRAATQVTVDGHAVLAVRHGRALRVFADPGESLAYDPAARRLESATGSSVWNLNGRLVAGDGNDLQSLHYSVYEARLWVRLPGG